MFTQVHGARWVSPSVPLRVSLLSALACVGVGVVAGRSPTVAGGVLGVGIAAGAAVWLKARGVSTFVLWSVLLLGGYVTLTRGFSGLYLPVGGLPLYVGELSLALLLLPALWRTRGAALGAPAALLVVWLGYNAVLTVRDLPTYGIDTVHDAATWYYGLYAAVGLALWRMLGADGLRRVLAGVFVWAPVAAAIALTIHDLPIVKPPFADSVLFTAKTDIVGMHLLGAAAFFLTGQHRRVAPWTARLAPVVVGSAMLYVLVGQNRATFLGLLALLVLLAGYGLWRPMLLSAGLAALVLVGLAASGVSVSAGGRVADFGTVLQREASLLTVASFDVADYRATGVDAENVGTVSWRVLWWHALWDDAVGDPRTLLLGRGYGVDLRDVVARYAPSGIVYTAGQDEDHPLRSPHNIGMTLLARSGLIGLALWVTLLVTCFGCIVRATLAKRRLRQREDELLGVWFLAECGLIVLIALFGVVLEAPHAAIPFFIVLGAALGWASEVGN